jgi:hypothetical protein
MFRDELGDEVLRQHLRALGPELGPVFHELCGDFLVLNEKWRGYLDLFGASPRRVDLLDRAASRFFGFLQPTLFDDIALHLVRLTAGPRSTGHSFLTVRQLPELIRDPALRASVEEDIEAATRRADFAREWLDWRRESLGHRTLPLTLRDDTMRLASRHEDVQEVLSALGRVLNGVHQHFLQSELSFDVAGAPGDAMDLLHVLNIGVSTREWARDPEGDH